MIEQILRDFTSAEPDFRVIALRYLNPVGAHISGMIGEDPLGIPNNLLPYIAQVAIGRRDSVGIFGNDYDTHDGTGVRDYIHVMDLAEGHLRALHKFDQVSEYTVYNLGAEKGYSVLEMVNTFSRVSGRKIPYQFLPRREGDLAAFWADASRAEKDLNWRVTRDLDTMMADTWRWQSQNPHGYQEQKVVRDKRSG
ncbi:MAG: UDP-glucose 4-epimerase [Candidatus Erwinia impunctatus]|nr:UDP-glucose 4-epimerase [Culicoides impunctatus]